MEFQKISDRYYRPAQNLQKKKKINLIKDKSIFRE